jgi:dCTP deaminase
MVLSDIEILTRRAAGEIVIDPFDPADLGSASYDVRLGEHYYEASTDVSRIYNIYSESDVRRVWVGPKMACAVRDLKDLCPGADWSNIRDDDRIVMLGPRANLLCHTREFIGARRGSTTMMKARSSIGRSLVNVCQCAGMGDVGYFNRWTMEIHNRSDYWIPLVAGRRVAQIVFLETGETERVYISKYQGTDDLECLVRSWAPESMLPGLDKDRDVRS